ncbi:MAG TPA: phosphoribosyl-ATP diphosphatase [Candidatus Polarisedimenticolia bacterium]|nr:phosphoribosyl-ATP diphosphatase [Candidatus Polarisedimenticolia bacterium]
MIIPSLDLMGGRAVQLRRGAEKVLESPEEPLDLARRFAFYGEVAVVDLDAALGRGDNRDLVRRVCRVAPCRVGGGVRREEDVVDLIKAGARRVIVGTAATPEFLGRFPPDWLMVALDARNGRTVDEGWRRDTGERPAARARRLERYCSGFLFTQVESEGMLQGVPLDPVREIQAATSRPLTVAGGVAGLDDVRALERLGCDAQVGMALYTGRLDLDEALASLPDFGAGPLPTIAQDEDARVLMLAWSTAESLRQALVARRGIYYSRSRRSLWRKGESSGHTQELLRVRYDCDADALLFTVRQAGPACHTGRPTCFGDGARYDLDSLRRVIAARRGADPSTSHTARLLGDPAYLRAKVREEADEVCRAGERGNLVWELADLLYHASALMEAEGIGIDEVESELRGRHR